MLKKVGNERRISLEAVNRAGRTQPGGKGDRQGDQQASPPATNVLPDSPQEQKHSWPKRQSQNIDCLVDADAQQTRDNRSRKIEAIMIT